MKQLMDTFDFDADDLLANRAGRLTERQLERLAAQRARAQRGWWLVYLLLLLLAFAVVAPALAVAGALMSGLGIVAALVGLALLVGGANLLHLRWLARDTREGRVLAVMGRALTEIESGSTRPYLRLHKQRFPISMSQSKAIRDGEVYTAYFAPRSGTLLALEPYDAPAESGYEEVLDVDALPRRAVRLSADGELLTDEGAADEKPTRGVEQS